MASLSSVTDGKLTEFKRIIYAAGFNAELLKQINNAPERAAAMVEALLSPDHQPSRLVNGRFVDPSTQVKNIVLWNGKYGWGYSDAQIREAREAQPTWPESENNLSAAVLVPYAETPHKTMARLWSVATSRQLRSKSSVLDPDRSRTPELLFSTMLNNCLMLKWELIDLGADSGKELGDYHSLYGCVPAAGILAAAAHFPHWIWQMDGRRVPYTWLPGAAVLNRSLGSKDDIDQHEARGDLTRLQLLWKELTLQATASYARAESGSAIPRFIS